MQLFENNYKTLNEFDFIKSNEIIEFFINYCCFLKKIENLNYIQPRDLSINNVMIKIKYNQNYQLNMKIKFIDFANWKINDNLNENNDLNFFIKNNQEVKNSKCENFLNQYSNENKIKQTKIIKKNKKNDLKKKNSVLLVNQTIEILNCLVKKNKRLGKYKCLNLLNKLNKIQFSF